MIELFFILKDKINSEQFYKIVNVMNINMSDEDVAKLKLNPDINDYIHKYRIPLLDETKLFYYINTTNINFLENDIIDYQETDNRLITNINIYKHDKETHYYLFFKEIINEQRRMLLINSDWIFLNIADKTIKFPKETLDKARTLRKELRDYFVNRKDLKKDLTYDGITWRPSMEFYEKYYFLLNL
tara:strand:+ start:213 stop:770 length:558 start_codon:yes stop_codon:yes gene_type:complete